MVDFGDKYQYSILDVCNTLHGGFCGSGEYPVKIEFINQYQWLRRRVKEWQPSKAPQFALFEDAVYKLAQVILTECMSDYVRASQ